ncbi:NADH-cytochrome b5 reductase 3-like [Pollicipes pollicipes]|uniref:NADH-cytochrome b5 reductase 3-like n=1 Tax=Pollicipes pollicipes TaxID=41117 RepID=UPI00188580E2|nr:NADH-cytochrome b5 reductase 3-like [Pollicipes pollicipes]
MSHVQVVKQITRHAHLQISHFSPVMAFSRWRAVVLSVVSGLAVVLLTAVAGQLYLRRRRRSPPRLLRHPATRHRLRLIERRELSPDTRCLRFALPTAEHVLGLQVGQHVYLSARVGDELVVRPYTPVSSEDDRGFVELVVKVYFGGRRPEFPAGGRMSQHLERLALGDTVDVQGPAGLLTYAAPGQFHIRPDRRSPAVTVRASRLGLIAGGTGITPMLQLIRRVLGDPADASRVWLLFANQTEADILLRDELDRLAAARPDRLRVWYTLDRPPAGWRYSSGFVTAEMLAAHLPPPGDETLVLMCGPPAMISLACKPSLDKLGYPACARFAY